MQVGWPGLSRAIALTAAVTSAFWVALGAWLFNGHVTTDHGGGKRAVVAGNEGPSAGLLSGFGKPTRRNGRGPASAPASLGPLAIPVSGVAPAALTDTFTQARAAGARVHDAIDIVAPEGAPVVAAAEGRVEKLFQSDEGGITVYVRSPDRRRIYYYAHLAGYAPGLREGQGVQRGQALGTVGHTGNADPLTPHLHFAVWNADPALGWYQDAAPINPYPLMAGKSERN
jgi:murein DD-endopeptidase MepM/ murein hydrolase activator NlpD